MSDEKEYKKGFKSSPRVVANDGAPSGAAPKVDAVAVATQQAKGACQTVASPGGAATADVVVPPGGLLLRPVTDSFTVSLRRFSDAYGEEPVATVPAGGGQVLLRLPPDASSVPWHARLAFGGSVRACARG